MPETVRHSAMPEPPPPIPSNFDDVNELQSIPSGSRSNDDDGADYNTPDNNINHNYRKSNPSNRGKFWSYISTPHCLFALLSVFITLATVTAVTALVLNSTYDFVENMVTDKATTVIQGAVREIHQEQHQVELRAETTRLELVAKNTSSSSDPYTILVELNSTLMLTVGTHLKSSDDSGVIIAIMGPPRNLETTYPEKQDIDVLGQCPILCRPATQPAFTHLAEFAIFRDKVINRPVEYRYFFSDANNSNDVIVYNLSLVAEQSRLRPSWAFNDGSSGRDRVEFNWVRGAPLRTIQPLLTHMNGSMFEGSWSRISVTSSPNGYSYYLTAFRQAFRHPTTNLTIIMNSIVDIKRFQQILKAHVSESLGDNNRLLLVDEIPRVIAYNRDDFGDGRLENCTVLTAPGSTDRECEKLYAVEHPSPFIRQLFNEYQDFIMHSNVVDVQQRWIDQDGTRYLMVVSEVFRAGTARMIAIYIISENAVVGDLKRTAILLAVTSGFVVAIGCVVLALAGYLSLRGAQQTVQLLSSIAVCLIRYDLEAAMVVIISAQSRRTFFKAPTAMEIQFTDIIKNLGIYRRFLPVSILLRSGGSTPKSGDQSTPSALEDTHKPLSLVSTKSPAVPHPHTVPSKLPTSHHQTVEPNSPSTQTLVTAATHPNNHHRIHLPSRRNFHTFIGSFLLVDIEVLSGSNDSIHNNTTHSKQPEKHSSDVFGKCILKVERFGGIVEMIRMNQILVSFNCHTKVPQHEAAACHCALEIRSLFNDEGGSMHRSMAIAITSGSGIMGSAGSASVKAVVLAGEPVDLVLRLSSLQRMLGVSIIASHATALASPSGIDCVPVDTIAPLWWQAGRSTTVEVFTILDSSIIRTPAKRAALQTQMSVFQKLYAQREDPVKAATAILRLPTDTLKGSYSLQRLLALCEARISHQKLQQQQQQEESGSAVGVSALKALIVSTAGGLSSSTSCIRAEMPWLELEGRDFFLKFKSEQESSMLTYGGVDGLYPQNIDPTVELYRAHEAQRNNKRSLLCFRSNNNSGVVDGDDTTVGDEGNPLNDNYNNRDDEGDEKDVGFTSLFGMFLPAEQHDDEEGRQTREENIVIVNSTHDNVPLENDDDEPINNHHHQNQDHDHHQQKQLHNRNQVSGGGNTRHLVEAVTGDKYFITGRSLGEGTFGCVVLALHETGGLVAMKQIPIGSLEGGVEPLIAEMALLKDLNHPCIASYVTCAVGSKNDTFYIMTEYLPAGSLAGLISALTPAASTRKQKVTSTTTTTASRKSNGFTVEATCRYAHDIADGLHYLHSRQPPVLHLDIKPDNVLMTGGSDSSSASCKLIDFGTSKFFVEVESSTTVRGTPRYMAPEAALGEVSPASDIYSVGVTMLHMLLGHSPWSHILGDDSAFLMRLMRGGEMVLQMPSADDHCDPAMITLIKECTAKNPQDRPSAKELRNRLASLITCCHQGARN